MTAGYFGGCKVFPYISRKTYSLIQLIYTPENQHGTQNEGLEDDFPFQTGDFQVPC